MTHWHLFPRSTHRQRRGGCTRVVSIPAPLLALLGGVPLLLAQPSPGSASRRTPLEPTAARALSALTARLGFAPRRVSRLEPSPGPMASRRISWVGGFRLHVPGATPAEQALQFLARFGGLLGITGPVQPATTRVIQTPRGAVVRCTLQIHGVPVLGADVIVTLAGDVVTSAAGGLAVPRQLSPSRPALAPGQAAAAVLRVSGRSAYRLLGLGYIVTRSAARLVYRFDQYRSAPPVRLILGVDAATGDLVSVGRAFRDVEGYVYDPSPAVAATYEARTLTDLTSSSHLEGTYATTYQCGPSSGPMDDLPCQSRFPLAAPTDAAGDYYLTPMEPSTSDPFAEVQVYYHVTEYSQWLEDRFGFAWSCAGSRAIDVHVNMDYANAFYGDADGDPNACDDLTFGQGSIDYAYDAEVIYHEFTHGMNNQTAALGCPAVGVCLDDQGLNLMPSAVDEALADYFSMTHTGDPNIGEYAGGDTGDPYIRTALNQKRCPWDVTSESHTDGEIVMGGAWTLRQTMGADKADALLFSTLTALPEDLLLDTYAAVMSQAAMDLQAAGMLSAADVSAVQQMLGPQDRALQGCDRFIPLDGRPPGQQEAQVFALPSYPGMVDEWPLAVQLTLTAPANARRLRVTFWPQYGTATHWTLYARRDQPVFAQMQQSSPTVVADHTFTGDPYDLIINGQSNPPLVSGSTYYVTAVYAASDYEIFSLTGDVSTGPPIRPDASVPPDAARTDAGHRDSGVLRPDGEAPPRTDARAPSPTYQPDSFTPRPGCACDAGDPGPFGAGGLPFGLALAWIGLAWRRRR